MKDRKSHEQWQIYFRTCSCEKVKSENVTTNVDFLMRKLHTSNIVTLAQRKAFPNSPADAHTAAHWDMSGNNLCLWLTSTQTCCVSILEAIKKATRPFPAHWKTDYLLCVMCGWFLCVYVYASNRYSVYICIDADITSHRVLLEGHTHLSHSQSFSDSLYSGQRQGSPAFITSCTVRLHSDWAVREREAER